MVITIDGPTASGKSSIARLLAEKLGIMYLNTGFLYRALAYILVKECGYTRQQLACVTAQDISSFFTPAYIRYDYTPATGARVFYKNSDITPFLKTPEADQQASIVSSQSLVRDSILVMQRHIAQEKSLVAEGRDTGSIVYPEADYKFFLTAPLEVRAKRWQEEKNNAGLAVSYQDALDSLKERDTRDMTRVLAPLVVPIGAQVIDTNGLTIPEAVEYILTLIKSNAKP